MKIFFTIFLVVSATGLLLTGNSHTILNLHLPLHENLFLNKILNYQIYGVLIALIVLLVTLKISPASKSLLRFGDTQEIASKIGWMGISGKETWQKTGKSLLLFITLATALFMGLGVFHTQSVGNFELSWIPIIVLISATNAFLEEIIYRFSINGGLMNTLSKEKTAILSGIIFGLPHYVGFPTGITGIIMAGILGYILSRSVYETRGIGIAWSIHFIQDIVIFSGIFMMNLK